MLRSLRSELVKFRRPSVLLGTAAMVGFIGFGAYFGIDRAVAGGPMGTRMLPELRTDDLLLAGAGRNGRLGSRSAGGWRGAVPVSRRGRLTPRKRTGLSGRSRELRPKAVGGGPIWYRWLQFWIR